MSTTDRPDASALVASDVAARLQDTDFLRLVAAPTGDALAAAGLLSRAIEGPFQATVAAFPSDAERATEADCTVGLGLDVGDVTVTDPPFSRLAFAAADRLGGADPWLALAGTVAAGVEPSGAALDAADPERRPGLAVPTADPADGLAHTTLVHGSFSGDREAAAAALGDAEGSDGTDEGRSRRQASLVALTVAEESTPRGATAVERLLRPHVGGPLRTVGGYADVLDALARTRPGCGVALAAGAGDREAAVEAWRAHGRRAHAALAAATTARYDGVLVAQCERGDRTDSGAPLGTVARLLAQYRSPEPVVLAVADGRAAAHTPTDTDVGRATATAADTVGGTAAGTRRAARVRFRADTTEFAVAFREAL
jgi:hypothetical protein